MASLSTNQALGLDPIRAEIHAQVSDLGRRCLHLSLNEVGRRADRLRQLGMRHGFTPLAQLAASLSDAIARDGRAAIIPAYVQSMIEAVYCDSHEADAGHILLASVGVRLAG